MPDLIPERRRVARAFARDCARLMEVEVSDLGSKEFREIAERHMLRLLLPEHRRAKAEEARLAAEAGEVEPTPKLAEVRRRIAQFEPIAGKEWNPYWHPLPTVAAELGRLRTFLLQKVVPIIDRTYITAKGLEVKVARGEVRRMDQEIVADPRRVSEIDPREASPFSFVDAAGQPVGLLNSARGEPSDLRDGLFTSEPALAVNGIILTLHYAPWGRCPQCQRVFACGRRGSEFCQPKCRRRDAYMKRSSNPQTTPLEAREKAQLASARSLRIYHAKKAGTWVRKRKPGAGRPKKSTE